MSDNRDHFAHRLGSELTPEFLSWVRRQLFDPQGASVSALLAIGLVTVSLGWEFSLQSSFPTESFISRLETIYEHFTLDTEDLSAGRYHVVVLHAFLYNDVLHTIIMTFALLYFATYAEKRTSSGTAAILFFAGIAAGGVCQVVVSDPVRVSNIENYLETEASELSGWQAEATTQARECLLWSHARWGSPDKTFSGPAAGVMSFVAFSLVLQLAHSVRRSIVLMGASAIWVCIDWFGFFHFESEVGVLPRVGGAAVGAVVAVMYLVATRRRALRFRVRNQWN